MKKKTFYVLIMSIIWFVAGLSCNKTEMSGGNSSDIIGEWKLVKVIIPFTGETYDYSQFNISYNFNKNAVLSVSGKTDHIQWYGGHETGEYSYSIIKDESGFILKINNRSYGCHISSKKLEISDAPLDGFIYYLEKIN